MNKGSYQTIKNTHNQEFTGKISYGINWLIPVNTILLLLLINTWSFGNDFRNYIWYFGNSPFGIQFNLGNGEPFLISNQGTDVNFPFGVGGSAVAVDQSGSVLFYAHANAIFDRSHQIMPNGAGIPGEPTRNQAVAIVPIPGNPNQYYVILNGPNVRIVIVDMSLTGNDPPEVIRGDAIRNQVITPGPIASASDAMIVIQSPDDPEKYFLVVQSNNHFRVYEIGNNNQFTLVSEIPKPAGFVSSSFTFHPSGKIAVAPANANQNVILLDFDGSSGAITFDRAIPNSGNDDGGPFAIYDVEFNEDGSIIYLSRTGSATQEGMILQYDLNNPTATLEPVNLGITLFRSWGLQRGPDGRIYHIYQETDGGPFLVGRINEPDSAVALVNYQPAVFGNVNFGGRQFPQFSPPGRRNIDDVDFQALVGCLPNPAKFMPTIIPQADSYTWDFGDGTVETWNSFQAPIHLYEGPGSYEVSLVVTVDGVQSDTIRQTIIVLEAQEIEGWFNDTTICPGDQIVLDAGMGQSYRWSTGETTRQITVSEPGNYWVVVNNGQCNYHDYVNVEVYGEPLQLANTWQFGTGAGIDFNEQPPEPLSSAMQSPAGVATISDRNGQTLFYTDGNVVYGPTGAPLPFADPLNDVLGGNNQATQSSIIVPFPGDETLFYIFTTEQIFGVGPNWEMKYSIVDIKEGDEGTVVASNKPLFYQSTERITVIGGGNSYWLLAHEFGSNTFRAYPITENGIGNPVLSSIGSVHDQSVASNGKGYMKFSQDGTKVAVALAGPAGNFIEVFDFDPETGELSNMVRLPLPENYPQHQVYGLEFAGGKLFASVRGTGSSMLYEFHLEPFIEDSIMQEDVRFQKIAEENGVEFGALQLGPDQQIYLAINGSGFLGQFAPNLDTAAGTFSNFDLQFNQFDLNGGISGLGLPNFIQNIMMDIGGPGMLVTDGCLGTESVFVGNGTSSIDEFIWTFGDGSGANTEQASHIYQAAGAYDVRLIIQNVCVGILFDQTETINITPPPAKPTIPEIAIICNDDLILDANQNEIPGLTYFWSTGDTTRTIVANDPGLYFAIVFDQLGCSSEDTTEVFDGRPVLDLGPNQTVCQNEPVAELDTRVVGPHIWAVNGNVVAGNTGRRFTPNTSTPGVFQITVQVTETLTGCIAYDTLQLTVNAIPEATYTVTRSTCGDANGAIEITSDLTGLSFEWFDAAAVSLGTNNPLTAIPSGAYELVVTNNLSLCTRTYAISVSDETTSFGIVATNASNCDGGRIEVTLNPAPAQTTGISYTLLNQQTGDTRTVIEDAVTMVFEDLEAGEYIVQVEADGCRDESAIVNVTLPDFVDLNVASVFDLCDGQAQITAVSNTPGANVFALSGPNNFNPPNVNAQGGVTAVMPIPQGTYNPGSYTLIVEVRNDASGLCPTEEEIEVNISDSPSVNLLTTGDACGGTFRVTAVPDPPGNYSYVWTPAGPNAPVFAINQTTSVSVTVRNQATGCEGSTGPVLYEIFDEFTVVLSVDPQPCDDGEPVTLSTALSRTVASPAYRWFQNQVLLQPETSSTHTSFGAGVFRVEVTEGGTGCRADASLQIVRLPVTPIDIEPRFVICPDPPASEIAFIDVAQFTFAEAILLQTGASFSPIGGAFELTEEGTYRFILENDFGCITIDTTIIDIECIPRIVAPNAFSPNATRPENQSFKILPSYVGEFEIYIFNRWGEIIFFSSSLEEMEANGWDGTFKGQFVPMGTYAYVMKFRSLTDPQRGLIEQHGAVTVIR
ncbi:MAG: PKD domain-containing protein [Cyclobacteriaceae bacterium]|nr:PKD domain-containing protein [Cyclobacteriaceae bacterium]